MGTSDQSEGDRSKDDRSTDSEQRARGAKKDDTGKRTTWPKDPKRGEERGQEGKPGMRSARDEMQEAEDRLNQDYDA